jgi:hypothetical protein
VRGGDIVVVHNNNNNNKSENNKTEAATTTTTIPSPALGGSAPSPAGSQHQSASRTGSTGRYDDGKSGGGGRSQRPGGSRGSTGKRDYDQSKTMYTQ